MIIIKRFLPLAAVLLAGGAAALAEATPPDDAVSSAPRGLRDVPAEQRRHEPIDPLSDVDAEFADFDEMAIEDEVGAGRRLQSGSTTTTTRCNTWCKLKESLGLTLIGLLLICVSPCLVWKNEGRQ